MPVRYESGSNFLGGETFCATPGLSSLLDAEGICKPDAPVPFANQCRARVP